jgi:hypothetical protein
MVAKVNFSLVQGDTFTLTSNIKTKSTGVPLNLTGSTISGKVLAGGVFTPLECSILNAANGDFKIGLPAATTATLPAGVAQIEVQIIYADATVKTIFSGNLVISKQVA